MFSGTELLKHRDVIIGEKGISTTGPVFFVAEITYGYQGSLAEACRLVDAAAECGADGVKVRASRSGKKAPPDTARSKNEFRPSGMGSGSEDLSWDDLAKLKAHTDARMVSLIAVPCDEESADFLKGIGIEAFQIASRDLTYLPLLRRVASKGKPVILTTGMSFMNEVAEALLTLKSEGATEIVLMHSTCLHPAEPQSLNLRAIATLRRHFELPVGYADHCEGILFAAAAATLGASAIEKSVVLDRCTEGAHDPVAVLPGEMRQLIRNIRAIETSLGDGRKRPSASEVSVRTRERRSVIAAVDIRAHETIAPWMLACESPGSGLEPGKLDKIVGMRARRDIARGMPLKWEDLSTSARWHLDFRTDPAETVGGAPSVRKVGSGG